MSRLPAIGFAASASLLLLSLGCHGGSSPLAGTTDTAPAPQGAATPLPLALGDDPSAVGLAVADLHIDLAAQSAVLQPVRSAAAVGDIYSEIGLTPAFDNLFGDHFKVSGLRKTGPTTLEVDFRTSHPFTAAIRPDLAIFNLKLWVALNRPATTVGGIGSVPEVVTNADGYGRMWRDTTTQTPSGSTVDVQPYVILHEDPSSAPFDWHSPAGFNVLFPGQTTTDTVGLDLGSVSTLDVRVFLTADYGQSATRPTRQNPAYDLPKFAGNAPWKVQVTELANNLQEGVPASSASFQVDIWDWKNGQGLNSDVTGATLELPAVGGPTPTTVPLSGTGQDPTPLSGVALVPNSAGALEGDYWGLVSVTDSASGTGLKDDLVTAVPLGSYNTYQWFRVHVGTAPVTDPPTAVLDRVCPGLPLSLGETESFDGTGSIPGSGAITDYEWDFEYDGSNFNVDATGASVTQGFAVLGTYTVALRVRDVNAQTDIDTTLVTVLPTAQWGAPIRLTTTVGQHELFDTQQNSSNALSVGPDGRVHLAWFTFLPYTVYHCSFQPSAPPITWDAPEPLAVLPGGGTGQVSCQTTDDNITHISFAASSAGDPRMYLNNSGGVWGTPVQIPSSADPGRWERTLLVAGVNNSVGFLGEWGRGDQPPSGSGLPALPDDVYFTSLSSGAWQPLTRVGGADMITSEGGGGRVESEALVGTASGEWIAVVESLVSPFMGGPSGTSDRCKLVWSQTTGGVWPPALTDLYNDTNDYDLPILARSPNGMIWLGARPTSDIWSLAKYDGTTWSPSLTQVFDPTGVNFSRLPLTQFSFDALGRGCILVSYREPTAPVQAKFFLQDDPPSTLANCAVQVVEAGLPGVGKPMCQIAQHGDGRFTAVWLTTKYDPGNPYVADTEIEYSTFN